MKDRRIRSLQVLPLVPSPCPPPPIPSTLPTSTHPSTLHFLILFCAVQSWGPLTFWYRQDNLTERPTAQLVLSKDTELILCVSLQPWH